MKADSLQWKTYITIIISALKVINRTAVNHMWYIVLKRNSCKSTACELDAPSCFFFYVVFALSYGAFSVY